MFTAWFRAPTYKRKALFEAKTNAGAGPRQDRDHHNLLNISIIKVRRA